MDIVRFIMLSIVQDEERFLSLILRHQHESYFCLEYFLKIYNWIFELFLSSVYYVKY